ITGPEPAILKGRRVGCRIVLVTPGEGRTSQRHFATFARRQLTISAVHDRNLGSGRYANRAKFALVYRVSGDLRGGFRHAIGLYDRNAKRGLEPGEYICRQGSRRSTNQTQRPTTPTLP